MTAASPSPDLPDDLEAWAALVPASYGSFGEVAAAIARALIAERAAHAETRERLAEVERGLIEAQRDRDNARGAMRAYDGVLNDVAAERDAAEAEAKRLREASKASLLVLCALPNDALQHLHPNALKDVQFAIEANRAALSPVADPREHDWHKPEGQRFTTCRRCKVVYTGENKPCSGGADPREAVVAVAGERPLWPFEISKLRDAARLGQVRDPHGVQQCLARGYLEPFPDEPQGFRGPWRITPKGLEYLRALDAAEG